MAAGGTGRRQAGTGAARKVNTKGRVMLIAALLALGYIGITARLVYLQVIRQSDLAAMASRQQTEVADLPPRRGTIYDRNGHELAVSMDAKSLYGVPANSEDPLGAARRLAPILGMDAGELADRLSGGRKFVWLARKVDPGVPDRIDAAGLPPKLTGWLPDSRRYYPKKALAAHVLGFTGTDSKGLEGLEASYEVYVGGIAGQAAVEKDGSGKDVLSIEEGYVAPKPGCDVTLTIDEKVQYIAEKELDRIMAEFSPISATAIVMDPNTGEVLAMANRPGFNPNSWQGTKADNWRNRAVTDPYEPGSTFKLVTAAAALEEGIYRPSDTVNRGENQIEVGGRIIHNSHKEENPKSLTFSEVIQKSDNVGTVKIALRLGDDRLHGYAQAFGFGAKTGVDLPGENPGLLRDVKDWSGVSIASVAFGQEVSVTPLQVLTAVNCIANGGWYCEPYIVSEVRSADGTVLMKKQPNRLRRVVSGATAKTMTKIMSTVVEEGGTALEANIRGYQVAGKTGTAQKFDPAIRRYSKEKFMSSFVGFVPAESPKVSILVVVNEPHGQHYGGLVAAPAFRSIALGALTYMKVPTRMPEQTVLVEGQGR
ncbi:MAG: penicillin-binding protein 2 [Nitrospirae bacterium]|nr:penicillin-binding protein 2 [Nitrospirota bacterium]